MNRVALYARVSSRRQEQEGTIESQIAELTGYIQSQPWTLAPEHIYIDNGVSGSQLARPALDRLRDDALLQRFDLLVCLSPDRLARNLAAQHVVLYELARQGIEVRFLNQPEFADSAQALFWQQMNGIIAELERSILQDRMRRGRLYRLRQGQAVPTTAPYGYRYQPAQAGSHSCWLPVTAEAEIVEQVFVWYAQQGDTLSQIARRLHQSQTPSPEGKRWGTSTLARLLRQSAYKGVAYYARTQADAHAIGQRRKQGQGYLRSPRYVARPAEEWIAVQVPALVTEPLWQAAQTRLQMNAHFAKRNSHHPYLLRGLLVCATCGHLLSGRTQGQRSFYHCLHGGKHRAEGVPLHSCVLDADVVEPLVWHALAQLLQHPHHIHDAWQTLIGPTATSQQQRSRWQRRHDNLHKQRQRLLDGYQHAILSLDELNQRVAPLEIELRELAQQLAQADQPPLQLDLETFTQRLLLALQATNFETKQEVLRLLIERIVVSDEALSVEHIIPTLDPCRLDPTRRDA
jgi:site-specific DNA recombinase